MNFTIVSPAGGNGKATMISGLGNHTAIEVSTTKINGCHMMTVKDAAEAQKPTARGPRGEMVPIPADIALALQSCNIPRIAALSDISDSLLYNIKNGTTREIGDVRLARLRPALAGMSSEPMTNGAGSAIGGVC